MLQPLDIPYEMNSDGTNSDEAQRLETHVTLLPSIVLFGGQGSPSIFSASAASTAEKDSRSSPAATILLSRCHAAFLEELESLDSASQKTLAIDTAFFATPNDLLRPPPEYHRHAVFQATTICLCQLLHYLAETQRDGPFESSFDQLIETSGFSSGVIPAAVVAHSRTLGEFVASGTEGFRLAFWVACRTFFWSLKTSLNRPVDAEATCSLVVRGLSQQQVEDRLQLFAAQESSLGEKNNNPSHPIQELSQRLHVSAISSSNVISISGPRVHLSAFKLLLGSDEVVTRFAHVHGWYHGGDQLECVVEEVVQDIQRRFICFPTFSSPAKPIRSTLDGILFDAPKENPSELLLWLVRHLLVHCVHWTKTAQGMAARVSQLLERQDVTAVRLLSFGPGSDFLFPTFQPPDPRIEFKDSSPFNARRDVQVPSEDENSIAIVGMSVNLPKGKGVKELWETLSQGLNAVQEIPESRFKLSDYYSKDSDKPRTMQTRHGAFLDDPFSFDNSFFSISPREAKSMDPQQRILLHAAQEALEDAGYVADGSPSFQRSSTGCYIGLATGDYTDNLRNDIDVFYSPGTLRAFHSGRISYVYKLSGPSIVTDTACSSSTVSIYQACRALQNGDCTAAIAGGVNIITSPDMYLGLARGHFLNPTGGCKPFDKSADGYCRAEGCVLFILKRLSDAIAENDRIHGVIRDVVVNQSGNSHSITHPHSETQIDLFQQLLKKTNVDPASISVIEAHGTGTQAGDAREIESIKTVFGQYHSVANPLVISSIKGNISHCEAASGAAGLAKLLLMLRERQIPVQVGFNTVNPRLAGLQGTGLVIPRETMTWNHSQNTPRRAMLNNFGAAGSNGALLLEDWPARPDPKHQDRSSYVFTLSAKSRVALQKSIYRHLRFLEEAESPPALKDICYTATARREIYEYRISMACTSVDDLRAKLEQNKAADPNSTQKPSATVFVFSGQGGLYQGMGEELMHTSLFQKIITICDNIVKALGFPSFLGVLSQSQGEETGLDHTDQIIATQCACVALEIALAKLVMSWGITPSYVLGHSLGEYAALCISGALTMEDTLRVVASRAKMMATKCVAEATGMLACKLSPEAAEQLISEEPRMSQLMVVCLNAIGDCVVGGPLDQIYLFQEECRGRKTKSKILDVPYAFHSPAMDPILEPLQDLGRSISFRRPTIPVFSNVFGRLFGEDDFSGDYFALHARQPVLFTDSVLSLKSREQMDGAVFLEIGPQPTTLPMLRSTISSSSCSYLGLLQKGQNAWTSLSSALVEISLLGYSLNWREVFAGSFAKVISLPGHPLEGSAYTIPFQEAAPSIDSHGQHSFELRSKTEFKLLPWLMASESSKEESVFTTTLVILGPLISGHNVGGTAICPASVFHELVLEGAQTVFQPQKDEVLVVTGISFANPLIYQPSQETDIVSVYITKHTSAHLADFKITSSGSKNPEGSLHCTGNVSVQTTKALSSRWIRDTATVARQNDYFSSLGKRLISTFQTRILYEAIFTRVVTYSSEYQSLVSLSVAVSNLEGTGSFRLPSGSQTKGTFLAPPVFTDTLLHAAGFIANLAVRSDEVCICSRVDSVEILYSDIDYSDYFTVSCSLLDVKNAILADAIALNSSGKVVAVVRGMEFKKLRLAAFQQRLSSHSSPTEPQSLSVEKGIVPPYSPPPTPPATSHGRSNPVKSGSILEDIKIALKAIVMEVGGFSEQDMDYTKSLDELGIDSLMQIEMISKITRRFPNKSGLDQNTLAECETLQSLESTLVSILESSESKGTVTPTSASSHDSSGSTAASSPASFQNPVTLHIAEGGATPLCLFHDGSGQVSMYARLDDYDRSTYGFLDPHFGGQLRPYKSLNQMTEYYLSLPSVPKVSSLIVAGWSFGGIMAFEAAQQLMAKGIDVKGLILIDSPNPINHKALPNEVIAKIVQSGSAKQTHALDSNVALREEFQHNASLLETYKPVPISEKNRSKFKVVMLRSQDTFDTEKLCGVRYDWLSSQEARDAAIVSWEKLVGGHVEVFPIPGNHFEAFSPKNISETRAQLSKACRYIEETR